MRSAIGDETEGAGMLHDVVAVRRGTDVAIDARDAPLRVDEERHACRRRAHLVEDAVRTRRFAGDVGEDRHGDSTSIPRSRRFTSGVSQLTA